LDKVKVWHFYNTSNEVMWPEKFSNYMQGSKRAILAIFQTGPGWPGTINAALKNPSRISKILFAFGADEFLTMPEGKIRRYLCFYVKIF